MNRNHFGFDPASSDAQGGNVSEYLLRDKVHRSTAMGHTDDVARQHFPAVRRLFGDPADEVHARNLNRQSVYVLDDNDPRRINIDNSTPTHVPGWRPTPER